MTGKWLIADRDVNEREGLKWLLKASSIPVTNIFLALSFHEFIVLFEKEAPDVVLMELDMIGIEELSSFLKLMQIYEPVLIFTSAEATFEKARLAIEMQALDLLIKPLSSERVKSAYQKATRKLAATLHSDRSSPASNYKDISYEALFLPQEVAAEKYRITAFKAENSEMNGTLHSFLLEFPFKDLQGIFPLSDLVVLLFKEACSDLTEQCQKVMRSWEEEFTEPLAVVIHNGQDPSIPLQQKYGQIRKSLEFTYYSGYRQVVEFDVSPGWVHIDPFLTPPEQRDWVDMLANLELEKIKNWLYEEFLKLTTPYPDPGLVRIRLTSILAQVRRFMKTHHIDENNWFEQEYRTIFDSILYDSVLYRTVQNLLLFIQKIFEGTKAGLQRSKHDPLEQGMAYMEANFSNRELRLENVAQHVNRNPSYFSHLLTQANGSRFTDLLTGIRMKEAKRLLSETSKSIKEISLLVGFQSPNYFSRLFKEKVGLAPKEYRMKN